jgi:hypothetical protein
MGTDLVRDPAWRRVRTLQDQDSPFRDNGAASVLEPARSVSRRSAAVSRTWRSSSRACASTDRNRRGRLLIYLLSRDFRTY